MWGNDNGGTAGNDNGEYVGLLNGTREVHAVLPPHRWDELHPMLPNPCRLSDSPSASTGQIYGNTVDHQ